MDRIDDGAVENIKNALNAIADVCHNTEPYIADAENLSREVADVALSISLMDKYTSDLDESLTVLSDLCEALMPVPVVGAIISKVGSVLGDLKRPLSVFHGVIRDANPTIEIVNKSGKSLANECGFFRKEMNFADSNFRNYANSLDVLKSCIDVLIVISENISDKETSDKLEALVYDIERAVNEISDTIKNTENKVSEVQIAVNQLKDGFDSAAKPFVTLSNVINGICKKISDIFSPITQAFNKIINAIAPIKWLLKALSKIFKKVINPIVNKILTLIGFDKLLDKITDAIKEGLHIDELENKINAFKSELNDETVGNITKQFHTVESQIQLQYDSLSGLVSLDKFEGKIMDFLQSSYDSFMNQDLPDFPLDSSIAVQDSAFTLHSNPYVPTKFIPLLHEEATAYIAPVSSALREESPESIKGCIDSIEQLIENVNAVYAKWPDINNKMILCDKYALDITMYAQLADELTAWIDCFKDISFFEKTSDLLNHLTEKISNEKGKIEYLKSAMDECQDQYSAMHSKFQEVYQRMPNQQDINDLYTLVMHVDDSYNSTKSLIESCDTDDKQSMKAVVDERYKGYISAIGAFPEKLELTKRSLSACLERVNRISKQIDSLGKEEHMIIGAQFFQALSTVNQHLAGLHSIISPTKQILKFISEKQDDKAKDFLEKLGNALGKASKYVDYIIQLPVFNQFIGMELPFVETTKKINEISQKMKEFDFGDIDVIKADINNLKKNYLQPTLQYTDDDGNIVYDYYIDQNIKNSIEKAGCS